jgi:hypothetical protein
MKPRTKAIGYGIILFWMFSPLIPAIVAGVIAASYGCKLDEGGVHSCIVFGKDIGEMLYRMGVLGLLAMGTFPSGILALIVFAVIVRLCKRAAERNELQ